jgi:hypothetical protein
MLWKIRLLFLVSVILLQESCGNLGQQNPPASLKAQLESTIRWLVTRPSEDILKFKKVKDFLDTQKVYVSMTTSPTRIRYVMNVIRTLNLDYVEKIFINIPEHFGRDQSTYEVPDSLLKHPKIFVNVIPKDLGPITKIIPAVDYIRANRPAELVDNDLVVSVDDDTGYPYGMMGDIIKHMVLQGLDVAGGSTRSIRVDDWHMEHPELWPMLDDDAVIEGFGGIGYRIGATNTEKMRQMIRKEEELGKGKSCYLSDDLVISYALALDGVHRYQITSSFFNLSMIRQYPYGMEADALHRGAGDNALAKENTGNANDLKYNRCFGFLAKHFPAARNARPSRFAKKTRSEK